VAQAFTQLLHGDSERGPIVVKIVLSASDEYHMHLQLHAGDGVLSALRVVPTLTKLDGPLYNFGKSTRNQWLSAIVMPQLTPLRRWLSALLRESGDASDSSTCAGAPFPAVVVSVVVQLLEVRASLLHRCSAADVLHCVVPSDRRVMAGTGAVPR
jgi:hypothetical protein